MRSTHAVPPLLLLLAGCCGVTPEQPQGVLTLHRFEQLDPPLAALAPAWERFAVTLPPGLGVKVWLEVDGEQVARLGLKNAWETPPPPLSWHTQLDDFQARATGHWQRVPRQEPSDTVWILTRDFALEGLESPTRYVELVLLEGTLDPGDAIRGGQELLAANPQAAGWAVPGADGARKLLQLLPVGDHLEHRVAEVGGVGWSPADLELTPGEPVVIAEFPSTKQVRLWIELTSPRG